MLSREPLNRMPDEKLIASLKTLVAKQSQLTAELLCHIAEVEIRKLHLVQAYGSMFKFCVEGLGLSESMAYKYIGVARAARKHEAILTMVKAGKLHLSAVMVLIPHLTDSNCAELLEAAAGQSKRQVEKLIAQRFPKEDVPANVRKLPQPGMQHHQTCPSQGGSPQVQLPARPEPAADDTSPGNGQPAASGVSPRRDGATGTGSSWGDGSQQEPKPTSVETAGHAASTQQSRQQQPRIEPLGPARYKVQFTASEQLVGKLRQAQELLRRQVPDGDPAAICERALDLLLETLMKKRFALTARQAAAAKRRAAKRQKPSRTASEQQEPNLPEEGASNDPESAQSESAVCPKQEVPTHRERAAASRAGGVAGATLSTSSPATDRRSRYIPASVRRLVADRDGLQCSYVGPDGKRCDSRDVEFHHLTPFARGGEHSVEEITLRCRGHNAFQAELDYGEAHIKRRIHQQRARSRHRRTERDRVVRSGIDSAPDAPGSLQASEGG